MARGGAAGQRGSRAVVLDEDILAWNLWLDEIPRPGYANMALDLTLLDRAESTGESWLRLYQWDPHCLSFGRHEPALRRYDVARINRLGLNTVRRPTGGRAVWHAQELTYAVAAPLVRFGSLQQAYRAIHQILCETFSRLGVNGSLAPRSQTPTLEAGACFTAAAGGEVLINGRKTVGSAQLRRGSALLQHGSILLRDEQYLVAGLALASSASKGDRTNVSAAASPTQLLFDVRQFSQALATTAAIHWPGRWTRVTDSGPLLQAAGRYFAQFQAPEWTWSR